MPLWTVMLIDRQLLINILNVMVVAQLRRIVELRVGTKVETLFVTRACPWKPRSCLSTKCYTINLIGYLLNRSDTGSSWVKSSVMPIAYTLQQSDHYSLPITRCVKVLNWARKDPSACGRHCSLSSSVPLVIVVRVRHQGAMSSFSIKSCPYRE